MEFFVDDRRVDDLTTGGESVADALRHVQTAYCPSRHVVIGLRCDGRDINSEGMSETLRKPASSFQRVEVFTGTKAQLVADAMEQASASLTDSEKACRQAADLFTAGNTVDGATALGECLRVWQQVHEAVGKSIEILEIDVKERTIGDAPVDEVISRPKQTLTQIKEALEVRDHVLLADTLQYELQEVTSMWHDIIAWLRQEAFDALEDREA